MQKLRLRLQAAKKSGRLDLSSKACWPHLLPSSSALLFRKQQTLGTSSSSSSSSTTTTVVVSESMEAKATANIASDTTTSMSLQSDAKTSVLPSLGADTIVESDLKPAAHTEISKSEDVATVHAPSEQVTVIAPSKVEEVAAEPLTANSIDTTAINAVDSGAEETAAEREQGLAELDKEEHDKAMAAKQDLSSANTELAATVIKDSDGNDLIVPESFVADTTAQTAIDYLAVQSAAAGAGIQKKHKKKLLAVDDAKIEALLKKSLEDLNPVELLECLTNPATKHEIIASQIEIPDLDFLLYAVPQAVFRIHGTWR